jgi:hypothetical protein
MILAESASQPALAQRAQAAYDQLSSGREVDYRVLSDLIGEVSGQGLLRALRQKYSAVACDAMLMPILQEIDRLKPVPPRHRPVPSDEHPDPLTADISSVR